MSFPRKLAPCPLLAQSTGVDTSAENWSVETWQATMCDRPFDCASCVLFDEYMNRLGIDRPGWVCGICLKDAYVARYLGFYDSGYCDICHHESVLLSAVILEDDEESTRRE